MMKRLSWSCFEGKLPRYFRVNCSTANWVLSSCLRGEDRVINSDAVERVPKSATGCQCCDAGSDGCIHPTECNDFCVGGRGILRPHAPARDNAECVRSLSRQSGRQSTCACQSQWSWTRARPYRCGP